MNLMNKAALYAGMFVVAFSTIVKADFVTATDNVGVAPGPIAVNPVTNKIYVVNYGFSFMGSGNTGNVTVIDGSSNSTTTVSTGGGALSYPEAIAVNPVTNKI